MRKVLMAAALTGLSMLCCAAHADTFNFSATALGASFSGVLTDPQLGSLVGKRVNLGRIPAYNYLDLSLRAAAGEHLDFTLTVQNLLNKQPPLTGSDVGSFYYDSGNTYPSTYDALGRRFAIAARVKF